MNRRPGRKTWTAERRIAAWISDGRLTQRDDCWVWSGALTNGGYGQIGMSGKTVGLPGSTVHFVLHRWMYEHHVGPVPDGLDLDHLCRVRACCNPWHLEPVTRSVNLQRAEGIGVQWSSRTHCSNDHEYTDENTARARDGSRVCRACSRAKSRRYAERYIDREDGAA